jgi:hypothetical protein
MFLEYLLRHSNHGGPKLKMTKESTSVAAPSCSSSSNSPFGPTGTTSQPLVQKQAVTCLHQQIEFTVKSPRLVAFRRPVGATAMAPGTTAQQSQFSQPACRHRPRYLGSCRVPSHFRSLSLTSKAFVPSPNNKFSHLSIQLVLYAWETYEHSALRLQRATSRVNAAPSSAPLHRFDFYQRRG